MLVGVLVAGYAFRCPMCAELREDGLIIRCGNCGDQACGSCVAAHASEAARDGVDLPSDLGVRS